MKRKQIVFLCCSLVLVLSLVALLLKREGGAVLPVGNFEVEATTQLETTPPTPVVTPTPPAEVEWEEKVVNGALLTSGNLVLVDSAYENAAVTLRTVPMRAQSNAYTLQAEACVALEKMMEYYTGYSLSVLYAKANAADQVDAICYAGAFSSGLDVCFIGKEGEELLDFYRLGSGKNWLYRNCTQFGFVPCQETATDWRAGWFRYVGTPHAALMRENKLSLTDYLAVLRASHPNYDHAWVSAQNGQSYRVFYCTAGADGNYHFFLPKGAAYLVSGDNRTGVVITAWGG